MASGKWHEDTDPPPMTLCADVVIRRTADAYRVGSSLTDDGVLASDHRPVFADITLH